MHCAVIDTVYASKAHVESEKRAFSAAGFLIPAGAFRYSFSCISEVSAPFDSAIVFYG